MSELITTLIKEHGLLEKAFPKPLVSIGVTVGVMAAAVLGGGFIFLESFKSTLPEELARFVRVDGLLEYLRLGLEAYLGFWNDVATSERGVIIKIFLTIYLIVRFLSIMALGLKEWEEFLGEQHKEIGNKINETKVREAELRSKWGNSLWRYSFQEGEENPEKLEARRVALKKKDELQQRNFDRVETFRMGTLLVAVLGCAMVLFMVAYLIALLCGRPLDIPDATHAGEDPLSFFWDATKWHSTKTVSIRVSIALALLVSWWLVRHGRLFLPVQWIFLTLALSLGILAAAHAGRISGHETIPFWEVDVEQANAPTKRWLLLDENPNSVTLFDPTTDGVVEFSRSQIDKITFRRRGQLPRLPQAPVPSPRPPNH
jgi:hypothetical protein